MMIRDQKQNNETHLPQLHRNPVTPALRVLPEEARSEPSGNLVRNHSHSKTVSIAGNLPQFDRIDINDLVQAANKGNRTAKYVEGVTAGLVFGAVSVSALATGIYVNALLGSALPLPVVTLISVGAATVPGYLFSSQISKLLQRLTQRLTQPARLLAEAQDHGLACRGCSYPIIDLPGCPECGKEKYIHKLG